MSVGLASSRGAVSTLPRQPAKLWLSDCSLLSFSRSVQKTVLGITPTTSTWTASLQAGPAALGPKDGKEFDLYGEGLGVGVRHGGPFQVVDAAVCPPRPSHTQPRAPLGQETRTRLPAGAGLWDEQEITASLSLWSSRLSRSSGPAVWRDSDPKG